MAKTIQQGFEQFLSTLVPLQSESNIALRHKNSVKNSIKNHVEGYSFFATGSFGNGTSIRHYSDSDYFAVLLKDNCANDSKKTLNNLKEKLKVTFPSTPIKVNSPAVCISFGKYASESLEITPCFASNTENNFKVYMIPNGKGGWMKSSPQAHNSYVKRVDKDLYGTLKPLIQLVKAWKYFNNVPIRSFYLELFIANEYSKRKKKLQYEKEFPRILKKLQDKQLKELQDPAKVSGIITACDLETLRATALSKLNKAVRKSQAVIDSLQKEQVKDAFETLGLIFKHQFPKY